MNNAILLLLFHSASASFELPDNLLASLCYVESNHNIEAIHYNDGGGNSLGICQIKYASAFQMGYRGTPSQLMEPITNIFYSGKFLKYQINRYHGNIPRGITAYNKGHSSGSGYSVYFFKVNKEWTNAKSSQISKIKNP